MKKTTMIMYGKTLIFPAMMTYSRTQKRVHQTKMRKSFDVQSKCHFNRMNKSRSNQIVKIRTIIEKFFSNSVLKRVSHLQTDLDLLSHVWQTLGVAKLLPRALLQLATAKETMLIYKLRY